MTSAFSWQNSVSLCPISFCTLKPNLPVTPGFSWLPTFAFQSPMMKRTSYFSVSSRRSCNCFQFTFFQVCSLVGITPIGSRVGHFWAILWCVTLLLLLLSRFSHVRLCATSQTAAHQAPPSLGFSRQEHWSGLPFPSPMHESGKWKVKSLSRVRLLATHRLQPTRLLHPRDFPGKSTGVGCHCFLLDASWTTTLSTGILESNFSIQVFWNKENLLMHHRFSLFQNTSTERLNSKIPVLKVVVHDKMQIHEGWWLCHRCIISPHPTSSELSIYSLEIKLDFHQKIVIHFSWLPLFFPYFPFLFSGEKSLIYDYFNIIGKTWGKSLNNWRIWRHTLFSPIHDNRMWYMF